MGRQEATGGLFQYPEAFFFQPSLLDSSPSIKTLTKRENTLRKGGSPINKH